MVITRLEKNKGKTYSVYVDDKIVFDVPEFVLMKLDIHVGMELNEKELDLIKNQVLISIAKNDVINFVSYKMRTSYEIVQKLKGSYPFEIIEEVINYLEENGYLNDENYAEKFIIEKKKLGKLSRKALIYKMLEKGIKREIIEDKLNKLNYDEKEYAKKYANKVDKVKNKADVLKTTNSLYRKGFSQSTIKLILKDEYSQGEE